MIYDKSRDRFRADISASRPLKVKENNNILNEFFSFVLVEKL